jgi:hypothetical protein
MLRWSTQVSGDATNVMVKASKVTSRLEIVIKVTLLTISTMVRACLKELIFTTTDNSRRESLTEKEPSTTATAKLFAGSSGQGKGCRGGTQCLMEATTMAIMIMVCRMEWVSLGGTTG